jgi:translin
MKELQRDIGSISTYLTKKQKSFDSVTDLTRDIIRNAAQAITLLHNGNKSTAKRIISSTYDIVKRLDKFGAEFEYYTRQACQEYAEASIFYAIMDRGLVPSQHETRVNQEAYLLGLMDVMGELKREILEELRKGNYQRANAHFEKMKLIYDTTRSLRFAEAVLAGFRRKQDTARIQLENAGSELLSFKSRDK